jgi:hypothetical protein
MHFFERGELSNLYCQGFSANFVRLEEILKPSGRIVSNICIKKGHAAYWLHALCLPSIREIQACLLYA